VKGGRLTMTPKALQLALKMDESQLQPRCLCPVVLSPLRGPSLKKPDFTLMPALEGGVDPSTSAL